ncbi:MAG: site-2 protease family protein [Patescibacteria group bacterium]
MPELLIFQLIILILSVVIHEVSHGYIAEYLGDQTARLAGRLTLNPLKHLDFFGSFLLPLILSLTAGIVFGWAKPVPYNPRNLKDPVGGGAKIAVAGPISNLVIALVFGTFIRLFAVAGLLSSFLAMLFGMIVFINILLAIFNLVPIPPLDGSKVLFAVLPKTESTIRAFIWLERYGMFIVFLLVFSGFFRFLLPIIDLLFLAITGQQFDV